ncbi:LLM class flavin-dependent oxidoreductase [Pseudonocardia adelaidensis]|uniref:Luciferase-like domain-containing protein n=1 Tax=Pseudonocardia adelaidensis TaxID=648754 RepID=A0ABP9NTK4_9PSEU
MTPPVLLNVARPWGEADPVALAARALEAGLDGVGLADSPRLFPDPLVETARVLAGTDARLAGPCVLGLGLRHPATVAGAVRTLAAHHPGRVVAVVGRGESSVRNEGLPVPSLPEHEAAMRALRELLVDGPTLLGAASGPRTIAATAVALGGVLVDVGTDPAVLARAVGLAHGAAVWVFLRAAVTSCVEEADAAARPVLGSCAARIAGAPDWYGVGGDELAHVRAVAAAHDYRRHGTAAAGHATGPGDALVRERFLVTGDGPTITARVRELAAVGVDGVVLAGAVAGVTERLAELATAVTAGLSTDPRE